MNRSNKLIVKLSIIAGLIIAAALIYFSRREYQTILSYQFNGVVDSVSYNAKGQAYVHIKGIQYYLSDNTWDFDHDRIAKGDSMIKGKNSMVVKLIKANGQTIIEGE
ncbi:hypothetical protein IDJ77_22945 [Mucilaginibacter sp. ZT4R22]|uniref:Uncharacterized protein n=1 Tax=Mucilaginibacter pankratovii TaxID=2772110 RepID=A0ABR7WWM3_9SPHI|nr:hypothetical protein [Mucilaginibacter pankratovii]MBD1366688.1 hypothetical protein [Mucilaginibacter pankratovii]